MPLKKQRSKKQKKYSVKANLQVFELSKVGTSIKLEISANRRKLGDLIIGRGSVQWRGRDKQKLKRLSWSKFAALMDDL